MLTNVHCHAAASWVFYTVDLQGEWMLFWMVHLCTLYTTVGECCRFQSSRHTRAVAFGFS